MVTVSIAEQNGAVSALMQQALRKKNLSFCRDAARSDRDYIFITPESGKNCDIVLVHDGGQEACSGDYITILNADAKMPAYNKKSLVITYGLNPLATVTASSIRTEPEPGEFFCCIQRSLVTLKGKIIEPQEFPVKIPEDISDISTVMAFAALGLVLSFQAADFGGRLFAAGKESVH